MDRSRVELKKCAICDSAFWGGPEDMACGSCREEYEKLREMVREYLWHQPMQKATLERIETDLGIPSRVARMLLKDPRFSGLGDKDIAKDGLDEEEKRNLKHDR
ncbi:MAG: hypothetical protein U9Q00_06450 [Synergistota bacterium]|nr:hypothetical protein [Synergistota bacterium]